MSQDPSQTLRVLFSMEPAAIERDLEGAEGNLVALEAEISALGRLPLNAITPETEARRTHLLMVQVHEHCRDERLAPELKTFFAASGAVAVAEEAQMAAADKGTLAELSARIKAIERREGLGEDDFWMIGEGPADYQELEAEFGRVLDRVGDTVFAFVLRRYGLEEQADLFERDRNTFQIQEEIGRRVVRPEDEKAEKTSDRHFREKYGEEVLRRVKARAKQLRRELGL